MSKRWLTYVSLLLTVGCGSAPTWQADTTPVSATEMQRILERVTQGVVEMVDSPWPSVRKAALEVLEIVKDPPLAVLARRALTDSSDDVRVASIGALGLSRHSEAWPILYRVYGSPASPRVRYAAAEVLHKNGKLPQDVVTNVMVDASSRREETAEASLIFLCQHPEIPLTLEWGAWEEGTCTVRLLAAAALMNRGAYAGFPALRETLLSAQPAVRRTLAWVLRHNEDGHRWVEQALKVLLNDTMVDVRLTAAGSAGELAMPGLAGPLGNTLLNAGTQEERSACAMALARMGTETAAAYLVEAALKGDGAACLALADAAEREDGTPYREAVGSHLDALRRALAGSQDPVFEPAALRILLVCDPSEGLGGLERSAFHSLDAAARAAALEGLAVHGDKLSVDRLETLFQARKDMPGESAATGRLLAAKAILLITQRLLPAVNEGTPIPE